MIKVKFKQILWIFLAIIFVLSINSFKNTIVDYSNNTNNINNDYYNNNNNNNKDNIFEENTYDTNTFTQAKVKRIVDGDTIIVTIDDVEYKVRFIGINSPEYTTKIEEYGKEATNYTTEMLTNKTIYLEKDVSETDKYGRLLRYVWLELPTEFSEKEIKEKMFNALLVEKGYAQAATYPPDVKYSNYFIKFEQSARSKNVGLWKTK